MIINSKNIKKKRKSEVLEISVFHLIVLSNPLTSSSPSQLDSTSSYYIPYPPLCLTSSPLPLAFHLCPSSLPLCAPWDFPWTEWIMLTHFLIHRRCCLGTAHGELFHELVDCHGAYGNVTCVFGVGWAGVGGCIRLGGMSCLVLRSSHVGGFRLECNFLRWYNGLCLKVGKKTV